VRSPRLLLAAVCLTLLLAAPASATVRYAAPAGPGGAPCTSTPCPLAVANAAAAPGDQVVLTPGTYAQGATLQITKAIEVGGQLGAPVPTIGLSGVQLEVKNAGAKLHDVRVVLTAGGMARPLNLLNGAVERVFAADNGLGAGSCLVERGVMRDSVCADGLDVLGSEPGVSQASVINVTAVPLLVGAFSGAQFSATIVNTIAHSSDPSHPDLAVDVSAGSKGTFTFSNSNYASVETTLSSGKEFAFTPPGTGGNQTAPPAFVNAAANDFSQLPTSPTIDAGRADPLLGALDLLGAARSQPRCIGGTPVPDIGAYEFTPMVACPVGPAPAPAPAPTATKIGFGKLKLDKAKGTATLEVKVPSAGQLALSGRGIVGRKTTAKGGATLKLKIKAKGRKAKKLSDDGKVRLRARAVFMPASATELPATKARALTLKRRP
jgi:hypothetical protein